MGSHLCHPTEAVKETTTGPKLPPHGMWWGGVSSLQGALGRHASGKHSSNSGFGNSEDISLVAGDGFPPSRI